MRSVGPGEDFVNQTDDSCRLMATSKWEYLYKSILSYIGKQSEHIHIEILIDMPT